MADTTEAQAETAPRRGFLQRFWRLARGYYASPQDRRRAWLLTIAVIVLTLAQILVQVRFNLWNRDFFNALENRDRAAFFGQMWMFGALIVAAMVTAVAQLWARQALMLDWRRWLVHRLQGRWLEGGRHYQLNFMPDAADNPDQRISENTRWATAMAVDLLVGLLGSILTLASFLGILWTLSGPLHMAFGANEFEIPGYMVWAALLYAVVGSVLTWFIGGPMVDINIRRNEAESNHRFALIRMRESSEGIALIRGEADEERGLKRAFGQVVAVMKDLYGSERRLMWLTSAYGMAAGVVPILVASPRYFAGAITLGVLMQITQAFLEVTRSLNWFVDKFPILADWRSHVERVAALEDTFDEAEAMEAEQRITVTEGPDEQGREILAFRDLQIGHSDGNVVIQEANAEIKAGEKVLIVGESGTGKSTLFRAIAGLWPWGAGEIRIPPRDRMMFMPQRPYIPLGSLRAALAYPAAPKKFPDAALAAALERCGLPHLVPRLEEEDRWDRVLSLGEQQRLAFARLLLHRPRWVFLDEATAALDEENQDVMMNLFREELAESALVSIGHRPGLDAYHDRTLHLSRAPDGARLEVRRRVGPAPRPKGKAGPLVAAGRGALRRMLRRS
ncbi:ABC transporter ATP-binding protein/permease [Falsiroseomonas stagni]|uniref:Putative ATP-binding cassette transporter n=1 Tax=Falsiroseomonas stagni DSM 19981 TaxID=1123062 RepID=A0A1I3ZEY0_9PROT|nr:ABC transporter ATP-binding protein/permease [Falsiroseomonas stagni]SFK42450.1 putative ATP-binding cassette transporter [Falsiroseomonas stagni DSM 19981]